MNDREKVIKGIECCREMDNPPGWRVGGCEECPYLPQNGAGCAKTLKEDAIAVLKAQEPRVMTLEEVLTADNPLFIEIPSKEDGDKEWCGWGVVETENREAGTIMFAVIGKSERLWCDVETMGEYFRCWTARPTEEQREAVMWG